MWSSNGRTHKDTARSIVFSVRPKKSVLLLTGYHMKDAIMALARRIINDGTHCVFVEREKETFDHIAETVTTEWPYDTLPTLYNRDLHRVPLYEPLDFAFIDLCGNLSRADALWIKKKLARNLLPGADLAFTFMVHTRNNKFIKHCMEVVASAYGPLYHENTEIPPIVATYLVLFKHVFFPEYDFGISFFDYHDILSKYTMLLVRLTNMQPKLVPGNSAGSHWLGESKVSLCLNGENGGSLMPKTKTKPTESTRSIAAALAEARTPTQKAAARKRLNALKKQREADGADPKQVEAGVKSWVTRYKNDAKTVNA